MASGGHARSGPAPDPNALRRDRKDDGEWTVLPREGFQGAIPEFPLGQSSKDEIALWNELWRKPQAVKWDQLDLKYEVAAYVRAFLESVEPGAVNGLKTAVLRMSADIGLSMAGMHTWRWKFSEDELARKREVVPVRSGRSARDRLASGG